MVVCNVTKPWFLYAIYVKMPLVKFETFLISTKEVTPPSFLQYIWLQENVVFLTLKNSQKDPLNSLSNLTKMLFSTNQFVLVRFDQCVFYNGVMGCFE
jgi:hypothetical protein